MHAKILWIKPYMITGSTNWTLAAKCNVEAGVVCRMEDQAAASVDDWFTRIEQGPDTEEVTDIDTVGGGKLSMEGLRDKPKKKRSSGTAGSRSTYSDHHDTNGESTDE